MTYTGTNNLKKKPDSLKKLQQELAVANKRLNAEQHACMAVHTLPVDTSAANETGRKWSPPEGETHSAAGAPSLLGLVPPHLQHTTSCCPVHTARSSSSHTLAHANSSVLPLACAGDAKHVQPHHIDEGLLLRILGERPDWLGTNFWENALFWLKRVAHCFHACVTYIP